MRPVAVAVGTPRDPDLDAAVHEEWTGCRRNTVRRSCSATCKAALTRRRRGSSAGRSGPSRAASRKADGCFGTDWCVADSDSPSPGPSSSP